MRTIGRSSLGIGASMATRRGREASVTGPACLMGENCAQTGRKGTNGPEVVDVVVVGVVVVGAVVVGVVVVGIGVVGVPNTLVPRLGGFLGS